MLSENHAITVHCNNLDVVSLECACGWQMDRPGEWPDQYDPWPVREIVNLSNRHLTEMTS